jgi:hypothetical protein
MTNDECLKNDEARMTNWIAGRRLCFVIRHFLDIRH